MAWEYYDYYMDCPKIQIFMAVCGFSMLIEILGTIWKQRICMIVVKSKQKESPGDFM